MRTQHIRQLVAESVSDEKSSGRTCASVIRCLAGNKCKITIERLECSKAKWMDGWDWVGLEISVGTDSKSTALRC